MHERPSLRVLRLAHPLSAVAEQLRHQRPQQRQVGLAEGKRQHLQRTDGPQGLGSQGTGGPRNHSRGVEAQLVEESGCRTAKVKVADPGVPAAADLERVAAVRDALGPAGRIRVDANAGWNVDEAVLAAGWPRSGAYLQPPARRGHHMAHDSAVA